jgi:hypothetical protein
MSDDIDRRGIDLLCPVFHVFDLTPLAGGLVRRLSTIERCGRASA